MRHLNTIARSMMENRRKDCEVLDGLKGELQTLKTAAASECAGVKQRTEGTKALPQPSIQSPCPRPGQPPAHRNLGLGRRFFPAAQSVCASTCRGCAAVCPWSATMSCA